MANINGRTLDRFDLERLQGFVSSADQEFTPEEHQRARRAIKYLRTKIDGPHVLFPKPTISATVNLTLVMFVLLFLMGEGKANSYFRELYARGEGLEILIGLILVNGGYITTYLSFAGMTISWPKWMRVIVALIGFVSLIWITIFGLAMIVDANGTMGGFAIFIYLGLIVWFIVLARKSGKR